MQMQNCQKLEDSAHLKGTFKKAISQIRSQDNPSFTALAS